MTRWLLFAALLLGAAWWLRRKPPMTPWPLYPPEGDDGLLPVDPWPQSQTYTFPDGSTFLLGEPVRR